MLYARRSVGRQRAHVRLTVQNCRDRVGNRFAGERRLRRQHLVEHTSERPDVGPFVDRHSSDLFGTHVRRRPEDDACFRRMRAGSRRVYRVQTRAACRVEGLRQPEVQQLHHAVRRDLDVRGLQVAMDDPLFVRGFERLGNLRRYRKRLTDWDRPCDVTRNPEMSASVGPSTSSMTKARIPSASSRPWICAMCG